VVASDIPANRMVIFHHHNGLLVPPRDPVRLASAVAWLADHPVERRRMAQNLRTTILQKFSSTVLLRRFNKIMGEVLSHTV
jgi:glycosyltransferase involved in cell wall biosynthesis